MEGNGKNNSRWVDKERQLLLYGGKKHGADTAMTVARAVGFDRDCCSGEGCHAMVNREDSGQVGVAWRGPDVMIMDAMVVETPLPQTLIS